MLKRILRKIKSSLQKCSIFQIYKRFLMVKAGCLNYISLLKGNGVEEEYFIVPSGTGDVYIIAHFYTFYLGQCWQGDKLPYLVVGGRGSETVAKMYNLPKTLTISPQETASLMKFWLFMGNSALHGRVLHWGVASNHLSVLRPVEGIHGFNMYSMFKYAVFESVEEQKPVSSISVSENLLESIFEKYALTPGKTVLLVPYSNSLPFLPKKEFWIKLVSELILRGYCVVTNTVGESEKEIPGTQAISFPIEQAVPFLNKAGHLISVRTGFADLTEGSFCKRIILYPKIENERSKACTYHEMFSINKMFSREQDYEIDYGVQYADDIIPNILRCLKEI